MEYKIIGLAHLAGVSPRALRYYDEVGILKPGRINSLGYRFYGQSEVDKLQIILLYRKLGFSLENIKTILNEPDFDPIKSLVENRKKLLEKKEQIEMLIATVNKTINSHENPIIITNKEKFEGFNQNSICYNTTK